MQIKIAKDKVYHFLAGAFIALCLIWVNITLALVVVGVVAFGKEIYDKYYGGTPEVADAVWTIIGGIVMVLLLYPIV